MVSYYHESLEIILENFCGLSYNKILTNSFITKISESNEIKKLETKHIKHLKNILYT